MTSPIIIIGSGLSGLSAAYHLKDKKYLIFEKDSQIGGACGSYAVGKFIFDKTIHIFYSKDAYVNKLVKDILLKDNFREGERISFCYTKGTYTEYPFQIHLYGLPPAIIKACLLGLVKARYEPPIKNPKNFREWIYKTFGEGIADYFMIPYNDKVWATPLEHMDYNWIAERVPVPDLDAVIGGSLAPPSKKVGWNNSFLYPLRGGIMSLANGFLPHINKPQLQQEITAIDTKHKKITVNNSNQYSFRALISSLPLIFYPQLISDIPQKVRTAIQRLEYNTVYTVNLGINRPNISPYHWVYYADADILFHRIYFPSNLSPHMAPPENSSVSVEVSIPQNKEHEIDETQLTSRVIADLIKVNILRKSDTVIAQKVLKVHPAYIIYNHSHQEDTAIIHAWLNEQSIFPVGRFGEWEYFNMDMAILSGRKTAQHLNGELKHTS